MLVSPDVTEAEITPLAPIEARYRTLLELGRGGTARVYLADSLTSGLKKLVVLKTLEPELSCESEMRELFRREAEVCARLNHPNIVQVHEIVELDSGPIIVMEYVEGISLSHVVKNSGGKFPKRLHLHTLTQLLAGLHYFHELKDYDRTTELKPVHRDVSPQNVIVMYEGAVKVLDFGIAKLANQEQATATGIVKGKLHYMSAEQLLSEGSLDRRADIFSVGIMLWEALAGRRMWRELTEKDIVNALLRDEIPNLRTVSPEYPEFFYEVVAKALAHDKENRYPTALDFQLDIERMLDEFGGHVQTRELASFMQSEFSAWRKTQESAVLEARSNPVTAPRWSNVGVRPNAKEISISGAHSHANATETKHAKPIKRRIRVAFWGFTLAVLASVVFVALRTKPTHQPPSVSTTSSNPIPQLVQITVGTEPKGALVLLDSKPLGRSPWQGKLPARQEMGTLELRAENYETVSKSISLVEDVTIDVHLVPLPPPVNSVIEAANIDKKPNKRSVAVRAPGTKPVTKSADCNPPYTLGADGVRSYKPECF